MTADPAQAVSAGTGRARSYGAITVVNAIASGQGAAIGIDLCTDATVTVAPRSAGSGPQVQVHIEGEPGEDPTLARECVLRTLTQCGFGHDVAATVDTRSTIPVSRGLKSSSAAANAIVLATLAAIGGDVVADDETVPDDTLCLRDEDVLRVSVHAAMSAGVTITGAFDDAAACYFGGLVVTDNPDRSILHQEDVGDLEVILVIPQGKVRTFDTSTAPTHPLRPLVSEAHAMAAKGDWKEAMLRNSLAYGGSYGISNRLVLSMLDTGAIAAGISGTGPAQAVLVRRGDWDCFTGILASLAADARVIVAHTERGRAHIVDGDGFPPAPEVNVVQEGPTRPPEAAA